MTDDLAHTFSTSLDSSFQIAEMIIKFVAPHLPFYSSAGPYVYVYTLCVFVCVARCVIYLQLGSEAVGTV